LVKKPFEKKRKFGFGGRVQKKGVIELSPPRKEKEGVNALEQ